MTLTKSAYFKVYFTLKILGPYIQVNFVRTS